MPKFLHVFNLIEKHGPVFLLLDFALFSKIQSMQKKLAFLATSLGVYLFSSQHATAKSFFFRLTNSVMLIPCQHTSA